MLNACLNFACLIWLVISEAIQRRQVCEAPLYSALPRGAHLIGMFFHVNETRGGRISCFTRSTCDLNSKCLVSLAAFLNIRLSLRLEAEAGEPLSRCQERPRSRPHVWGQVVRANITAFASSLTSSLGDESLGKPQSPWQWSILDHYRSQSREVWLDTRSTTLAASRIFWWHKGSTQLEGLADTADLVRRRKGFTKWEDKPDNNELRDQARSGYSR